MSSRDTVYPHDKMLGAPFFSSPEFGPMESIVN
jgi:hypothetical protein